MYISASLLIWSLHFLVFPLEAAPYNPDPGASPSLFSRAVPDCFPVPHPPDRVISVTDCYRVIHNIYRCHNPTATLTFSRDAHAPDPYHRVPMSWQHNNCVIGITMARFSTASEDRASLAAMGTRALEVIRTCVENGGLGGAADFGENNKLEVFVRGVLRAQLPSSSREAAARALALGRQCLSGLRP